MVLGVVVAELPRSTLMLYLALSILNDVNFSLCWSLTNTTPSGLAWMVATGSPLDSTIQNLFFTIGLAFNVIIMFFLYKLPSSCLYNSSGDYHVH